jgi:hypothetical protein
MQWVMMTGTSEQGGFSAVSFLEVLLGDPGSAVDLLL